jgi:Uma2 family endonuclease
VAIVTTLEEIQQAIRQLTRFEREDLAEWMLNSADFADRVAEPALGYAAPPGDRRMSVEEYLQMEGSSGRYEYVGGEIFAMAPATLRHEAIVASVIAAVYAHVLGGPCRAFASNAGVRLQVNQKDLVYLPDVMVGCGSFSEESSNPQYLTDPCLIVEVLSPSTEAIDRREKAVNYQHIASLEEYVLVEQDAMKVTIARRAEDWIPAVLAFPEATAEFRSIGLHMTLEQIYARWRS